MATRLINSTTKCLERWLSTEEGNGRMAPSLQVTPPTFRFLVAPREAIFFQHRVTCVDYMAERRKSIP